MTLDKKKEEWLQRMGPVFQVSLNWESDAQLKNSRIESLSREIEQSKDELRILFDFDISVRRIGRRKNFSFQKTKKVKGLRSPDKKWNPNKEYDPGHHSDRFVGGALPEDVERRIEHAMQLLEKWQDELTQPSGDSQIPKADWEKIRERLERVETAAESKHDISGIEDKLNDTSLDKKTFAQLEGKMKTAREAVAKAIDDEKNLIIKEYQDNQLDISRKDIDNIVNPLLDDMEVRRELWTRLVRERVIPANLVPDEYNETTQQFRGADDLYRERMRNDYDEQAEKKKSAKRVEGAIGSLQKIGENVARAIPGDEAKVAKQVIELTGTCSRALVGLYGEWITSRDAETLLSKIGDMAGSAISRSVFFGADPNVATIIAGSINAGISSAIVAKKVIKSNPIQWNDLVADIGQVVEQVFTAIGAEYGREGDSTAATAVTETGRTLNTAIVGATKGLVAATTTDPLVRLQMISDIAGQVVYNGLTSGADQTPETFRLNPEEGVKNTDLGNEDDANVKAVEQNRIKDFVAGNASGMGNDFQQQMEKLKDTKTKMGKPATKINGKALEGVAAKYKKEAEDLEAKEMEEELQDFRQQLTFLSGGSDNDPKALQAQLNATDIDKMINQMELDHAKLKMAEALYDSIVGLTAQFVEPVMMASSTKNLVKDAIMAYRRAAEFTEWRSLNKDAIDACSTQGYAFANRLKNLKLQITDRMVKAVFELGELVGSAAACGGVPAGVAVSKGSSAAKAAWALIKDWYSEHDLKKQWQAYKKAINRPDDHIMMRRVLQGNPTLSKYAMAYAAMQERDPIAIKGLVTCGLTNDVLSNPNTNAQKVVKYLETKFNEDPQLVKSMEKQPWQSKDNSPIPAHWAKNCDKAKSKLNLDLGSVTAIDLDIIPYDAERKKFRNEHDAYELSREAVANDELTVMEIVNRSHVLSADLQKTKQSLQGMQNSFAQLENDSDVDNELGDLLQHVEHLQQSKLTQDIREFTQDAQQHAGDLQKFKGNLNELLAHKQSYSSVEVERYGLRLIKSLRTAQPTAPTKNGQMEVSQSFRDYCQAVAIRAELEVDDIRTTRRATTEILDEYQRSLQDLDSVDFQKLSQDGSTLQDDIDGLVKKIEAARQD